MTIVEASVEVKYYLPDISGLLDGWTLEELDDLLEDDSDLNLGEYLLEQGEHKDIAWRWPEIDRDQLAAYVDARRAS